MLRGNIVIFFVAMASFACDSLPNSENGAQGNASSSKEVKNRVDKKSSKGSKKEGDHSIDSTMAFADTSLLNTLLADTAYDMAQADDTLLLNAIDEESISETAEYSEGDDGSELMIDSEEGPSFELVDGDMRLGKERLIHTEIVNVISPDLRDDYDSTLAVIERRLSLEKENLLQKVVVEKWISPVNYEGYKFNRRKLVLYGISKTTEVNIIYYLHRYYLKIDSQLFTLDETIRNKEFEFVADTQLLKYLLENAN